MAHRLLRGLTFSNVCSFLALTVALGTGTAYAADTVGSSDIINESILSVDIKNGEVRAADLVNNGVLSSKIAPGAVQVSDLHADAVDSSKILDGTIGRVDLGNDAVNSAAVQNESLTADDLANNSVDASEIADASIDSGEIVNESLNASDLASGSVGTSEVSDNSLTLSDLLGANAAGSISYDLGANSCANLPLGVSGAQVGQAALLTFTGSVSPGDVIFQPLRVTAANQATVRACNQSSSPVSVSGLGVRVITFG